MFITWFNNNGTLGEGEEGTQGTRISVWDTICRNSKSSGPIKYLQSNNTYVKLMYEEG